MNTSKLEVLCVSKTFGEQDAQVKALDGVSLEATAGQMLAIVGPSGCGKSTLLNVIGQILPPDAGQVKFDGQTLTGARDRAMAATRNQVFGYLFQDFALVEHDSVLDNVELPLRYATPRVSARERRTRAMDALARVGMDDLGARLVNTLSGGQRQRVGLARAIVNEPAVILADEPTGALDSANASAVFELLQGIAALGKIVVLVTHDLDLAGACQRVMSMRDGQVAASLRRAL
jgi:putative ABC transport system ATP-binding protein